MGGVVQNLFLLSEKGRKICLKYPPSLRRTKEEKKERRRGGRAARGKIGLRILPRDHKKGEGGIPAVTTGIV